MRIKCIQHGKMLLTILFSVCLSLLTFKGYAQNANVSLSVKGASLEQVMKDIEKQTNYLLVYHENVDLQQTVSVDIRNASVKDALDKICAGLPLSYKISGSNISLYPAETETTVKTVKGRITDAQGEPIIGATVQIAGTATGVITDIDGSYSIEVPESGETVLKIEYLGFEPIEVAVGKRTTIDVAMEEAALSLEGTVVTALGIRRSEKALNYNVQQVDNSALTTIKDANFVNSLNGKVAGVTINASSSGVGGESKVVMRGTKGISQSSNALYVIDGVPMYNMNDNGSTGYGSRGRTEGIADINPEDIESISVLTGAAAAALYGSHASNGAIVVTTKKGKEGKIEVTLSSNTEVMTPFMLPDFQNRYGNAAGVVTSWGEKLTDHTYMGYNPAQDFFQTGVVGTETVTVSAGNKYNQTYASASAVDSKGIVPNNGYHRYNFTFRNTTSLLEDKLKLDVSAQYVKQTDRNMVNQGIYSNPLVPVYLYPRGEDWEYAKIYEQYDATRKIMSQNWEWMGKGGIEWDNPYWTAYRNLRENDKSRYMLSGGLTWDILDWLKLSGRVRIDNTDSDYTEKVSATTNPTITEGSSNGYYMMERAQERQTYADVMFLINKRFGDDWTLNANLTASLSDIRRDVFSNRGGILEDGLPNLFNVFQLDNNTTKRSQSGWREQTQSVLGSVEVGYKGTYYLTVTGRNDWPSQLAGPHSVKSSFFYPSVGGSIVLSEIINMGDKVDFLKVRGSWASVGMPFARFIANPTYAWNNSTGAWETAKSYPIYDLKPEKTNSWEVGLTFKAFDGFSLDVSYYDTKTFNQTFDSQLSVSSGYTNLYVQTGNVRNRGVEVALGYEHQWGSFGWSTNYTFSTNKNEVLELMENYTHPETGKVISLPHLEVGRLGNAAFLLTKGGTLGDLYTTVDLNRDDMGNVYIDREGNISRNTNIGYKKIGSVFSKANMAWSNEFDIAGVNFGFMISARLGGIAYSATQAYLDNFGVSEASALARDNGGVNVDGYTIAADKWFSTVGANGGIPQYYTYDATNVRLQEAHIGYTIPRKKLGGIMDITLSLVGRNLWMIYCKAPFDPESIATAGNYYQGIDQFMMPSTRNVGFSLRLKF